MEQDKQIEERKKIISDICPFYREYGSCDQCTKELSIDDEPCYFECMARAIINNGYRKASDVAREIFEAVDKLLWQHSRGDLADKYFYIAIDELKKKYTEGEV